MNGPASLCTFDGIMDAPLHVGYNFAAIHSTKVPSSHRFMAAHRFMADNNPIQASTTVLEREACELEENPS